MLVCTTLQKEPSKNEFVIKSRFSLVNYVYVYISSKYISCRLFYRFLDYEDHL